MERLVHAWFNDFNMVYKDFRDLSVPMKPYIKGQYWMITTISLCDLVVIVQSE